MNNMDTNIPVEQLWYTWSDVGLSSIRAGFRIRAASPGLTEIYSDRVRNIDRTMRYVLPPGTDRFAITPDQAPVGLTFTRSEWNSEYLLVHKKYVGTYNAGRISNFFIHALALGEHSKDFTAEDAIWLWESPLWKTDSKEFDEKDLRNTRLDTLSIDEVYNSAIHYHTTQFQQVRNVLPFVIAAYLMRKDRATQLYIAAPAGQEAQIAAIIAGLTNCLPAQFLVNLTFSTYEPDVTKAKTELVGTSWIAPAGKDMQATAIFPKRFYSENLAVNYATQEHSNLQAHPHIEYNQLVADFAEFAAESLATGNVDSLYALRNYAEQNLALNLAIFLQIYDAEIVNTTTMDKAEIEKYLHSEMCIDWLYRKNSRKKILERTIENPWWGNKELYDILQALRKQAQQEPATIVQLPGKIGPSSHSKEPVADPPAPKVQPRRGRGSAQATKPTLTEALALLARSAIPEIVKRMEQANKLSKATTDQNRVAERHTLVHAISTLVRLMNGCLLPQASTEVWKLLFEAIVESNPAIAFLHSEWSFHSWLLKVWNQTFPSDSQDDDRMRPLLLIPWEQLGNFLKLGLYDRHRQWIIFALQELVATPIPTRQIALDLQQNYARETGTLLVLLAQEKQYNVEAYLIIRLIEQGYPLSAGLEPHIEPLLSSLNRDNYLPRSAKDLILALTRSGYFGTPSYQQQVIITTRNIITTTPAAGQELIDALIQYHFPTRNWMMDLLLIANSNQTDVLPILTRVYSTPTEQHTFFVQDGARYLKTGSSSLEREHWMQPMIALYQQLIPLDGRLERLFILLDTIDDPDAIARVLTNTPLEEPDMERFLTRYGQSYLQNFQQSPTFASIIVSNFTQLINAGYRNDLFFTIVPAQIGETYLTSLLTAAKLTSDQQARFLEQHGAHYLTAYPTMPLLREYIGPYILNFQIDFLEKEGAKAFFAFLLQQYKRLALDSTTQAHIQCWKIIIDYFTSPTTDEQILEKLAQALSFLSLPDKAQFTEKLAHAFFACIQTDADLKEIITHMRAVPKVAKEKADEYQFLYTLAQHAAEDYKKNERLNTLYPYLLFALNAPEAEQGEKENFIDRFLNRLLHSAVPISKGSASTMSPGLRALNAFVEQQYPPTSVAMKRWHAYLERITPKYGTTNQETGPTTTLSTQSLTSWLKRTTTQLTRIIIEKTKDTPF